MKDLYNNIVNFDLCSKTDNISVGDLRDLVEANILRKSEKYEIIFGFETNDYGVRKFIDDEGYGYVYYNEYENGVFMIEKYYFIN